MSASLVGSEMCIRDRLWPTRGPHNILFASWHEPPVACLLADAWAGSVAVSYTHLTLPTICSV
eukprot:12303585-Alexandrium_andersonii.AAC.1